MEEILDSLVSIDCGIPAIIVGGWFDFAYTYIGAFPGLEYGLYSFFRRSKLTSRKLVMVKLALAVILRPISQNFLHSSFFIFSAFCGVLCTMATPSSR